MTTPDGFGFGADAGPSYSDTNYDGWSVGGFGGGRSLWSVGARVGAVAEKDPGQPWTEQEVKERIWALEDKTRRMDTELILVLSGLGVVAVTMLVVGAGMWRNR